MFRRNLFGVPDPCPSFPSTPPLTQPSLQTRMGKTCADPRAVRCLAEWLNRAPSQSIDSDEEKFDIYLLICVFSITFVLGKLEFQKCQGWTIRAMPQQSALGQNHCCAKRKRVIGRPLMDEPCVLQSCNRLRKLRQGDGLSCRC